MALTYVRLSQKWFKYLSAKPSVSVRYLSADTRSSNYDIVVVGGGIIGCATAREIIMRDRRLRVAVVEKEAKLACHQSGHNSGVIHAGIYYKPGSLKAKLCGEGLQLCYKYCDEHKIPYKRIGKLIVAVTPTQVELLKDLEERARANNVPGLEVIEGHKIKELEPFCRGLKALWSPYTGIVDFALVTNHLGKDFTQNGGDLFLNFEVSNFNLGSEADNPVEVVAKNGKVLKTKYVFTCGGLQSDKLAVMSECSEHPKIVPFRGEYLLLRPEKLHMVTRNIYPVPDPRFPFLGVHFTPRIDGSVVLGPNAVLAFAREGYNWGTIKPKELLETVTYSGFRKMALKYIVPGSKEILKSALMILQMRDSRKYIPEITASDVTRGPSGVRAQAMNPDGSLVDDFVFSKGIGPVGKRVLHCRNAPSPAATSSLAIAKMLTDKVKEEFGLT